MSELAGSSANRGCRLALLHVDDASFSDATIVHLDAFLTECAVAFIKTFQAAIGQSNTLSGTQLWLIVGCIGNAR